MKEESISRSLKEFRRIEPNEGLEEKETSQRVQNVPGVPGNERQTLKLADNQGTFLCNGM